MHSWCRQDAVGARTICLVDWWNELRVAADAFLQQHGLLAAFIYLLVEEAGVPVPVPGDLLMLILGAQASEGRVTLWQAVVVLEIATVLGATILYVGARWAGRGLVYRYGRYVRPTPKRLKPPSAGCAATGAWPSWSGGCFLACASSPP